MKIGMGRYGTLEPGQCRNGGAMGGSAAPRQGCKGRNQASRPRPDSAEGSIKEEACLASGRERADELRRRVAADRARPGIGALIPHTSQDSAIQLVIGTVFWVVFMRSR